jgi:hypothetical protein
MELFKVELFKVDLCASSALPVHLSSSKNRSSANHFCLLFAHFWYDSISTDVLIYLVTKYG